MHSRNLIFPVLLLLAGCTILDPNPEATITRPQDSTSGPLTGEQLYRLHCAGCHGIDGISVASTVTQLKDYPDTASYTEFDESLTTGPSGMPAYPQLDSTQRTSIWEYIMTF
jgi:mono/diheme cytochrome c family protein